MAAQPSELSARLIDLFGNPATADPTKLYNNLILNPNGTVTVGTGLILPDGYTRNLTDMGRNRVINGGMDLWQRASTITGSLSGYQTADRFGCTTGSGSGHNAALSSDVPNNAFAYSWKFTVGTGGAPAAGNFSGIWHNIEGYNVIDFAYGKSNAQYGVLTFWVKSSIAGSYAIGFMNSSLNRNYITTYTITSANVWQQISVIVPGDTAGTWNNQNLTGLSICWDLGSGTTYQTATLNTWQAGQMYGTAASTKLVSTTGATWQLTGVQFELGSYNSPFERRLISAELNNCMRYFASLQYSGASFNGMATNTTTAYAFGLAPPVPMRATPTPTLTGTWTCTAPAGNTGTVSVVAVTPVNWYLQSSSGTFTTGQTCYFGCSAGSTVQLSAEL